MSDRHLDLEGDFGQMLQLNTDCKDISFFVKKHANGNNGEIQHVAFLADDIGNLYKSGDCSDVILKVEGCSIPAHRVILAARSDYFRALLYNGMLETSVSEIELIDTPAKAFKLLLKYIYTGKLSINALPEDTVLDVLGLAHKYDFRELETSISEYLKAILNVTNACAIFESANLYSLKSLYKVCLDFADKHAPEIISTQGFLQLSAGSVEQMVQRDSLCAPEIDIFKAIREWISQHPDQLEDAESIIGKIRLCLIKLDDLLNIVRPSKLVSSDSILDAIKVQHEKRSGELQYRGFLLTDTNVMIPTFNATVINDDQTRTLITNNYDQSNSERGFTTHIYGDKNQGIVFQLGRPFIINHLRLHLWDYDQRSFSYYVEASVDNEDWVRIIDHRDYLCRSNQFLYFAPRVINFIRVVGTRNTVNNTFHILNIKAMYTTEPFDFDHSTTLLVPKWNVATIGNNAIVIEGVSRCRNALINGETTNYDWDNGYTCHQLGSGAIVVQLPQPYLLSSMRLLLWDCDDRSYSYYVEVSCNNRSWTRIADKTQEQCRGWEILTFERRPIVFIRIVGTYNSANEVFHCVHFETPANRAVLLSQSSNTSTQSVDGSTAPSPVNLNFAANNREIVYNDQA